MTCCWNLLDSRGGMQGRGMRGRHAGEITRDPCFMFHFAISIQFLSLLSDHFYFLLPSSLFGTTVLHSDAELLCFNHALS